MAAIALLAAVLIASHSFPGSGPVSIIGSYCYWLVRIAVQSLLFFGARLAIEKYAARSYSLSTITMLAIIISHIPFVLSVTAMDIVLGYPELGIDRSVGGEKPRLSELVLEMVYLFDNHIALCLLLTIPTWILGNDQLEMTEQNEGKSGTLLSAIEPPLAGKILWVEAQEHYVRITTNVENRMVLARFSDIVRELSEKNGMQVHRSHWVAKSAIIEEQKTGQNVSLLLSTGDIVPVSRSFRNQLKIPKNE